MILGGWTRRMRPLPGELLTSCLARNAHAHGSAPYRFLELFWRGDPVWNRDFDRDPAMLRRTGRDRSDHDWVGDLAAMLGTTRSEITDATLAGWRDRLGAPAARTGDIPLVLSAGVFHRTRIRHALQACPGCLAEGVPYFRKEWRLGFAVACPVHGTALVDACGWCDAPLVPHRSMTATLVDCAACGRPIRGRPGRAAGSVPSGALALQRRLTEALHALPSGAATAGALGTARALIAASAPRAAHATLRAAFGLGTVDDEASGCRRFEHCRHAVRTAWLETVAAWLGDWPRGFLAGAEAIGATRRTFARRALPPILAEQVGRLPVGIARDRSWLPVLDEPVLRRLRRTDGAAYRAVRAERILAAVAAG